MELEPYLAQWRSDVAASVALADESTREIATRVAQAAEPALRLALSSAAADALAEVTAALAEAGVPAVAQLTTQGRDAVVSVSVAPPAQAPEPTLVDVEGEDGGTARITLRLPDSLKARADEAADAAGQSLNTFLIAAVRAAVAPAREPRHATRAGRVVSGWI